MDYRREIDGLRTLAVVPVILFHAGFAVFGGGFVGVDVFFVISGYLITSILLAEIEAGKFSIVGFYERRARRILPALFLMMAVCLPFAWLWLLPADLKEFSQGLMAVSSFISNLLFWRQSGYFDTAAELKPLLHTWSLAVEEQFYLFFPPFLLLLWRGGQRRAVAVLGLIAAASLATAHWNAATHPAATFFLLPTRAWELLMGSGAALYQARQGRLGIAVSLQQGLGLIGVGLIAFSIFAYSEATPFPSLYALVPTGGALLIILFAWPDTWVGRLLGSRAFVGIGLISYSAYLWHQPLFAFARQRSLERPEPWLMALLAVATFILATLSWRFVEKPFRQRGRMSRRTIFLFAGIGSAAFIGIGAAGHFSQGFAGRQTLPQDILRSFERTSRSAECFDKAQVHSRADWYCRLGNDTAPPDFAVVGDSHALSLLELFDGVAREQGRGGVFAGASGCPPLLEVHALREDQQERNCHALNQRIFALVQARKIRQVFLVARWTYYTDGDYSEREFSYLGLTPEAPKSRTLSREAFARGLENTVARYAAAGVAVTLVTQAPLQAYDPKQIYQQVFRGGELNTLLLQRLSVAEVRHRQFQSYVSGQLAAQAGRSTLLAMDDVFCDGSRCQVGDAGGSYYFDDDHLSLYGAGRLRDKLRPLLVQLAPPRR
jgi:peptidoglycan/LPS O-acetylase OafA/YrhL